jgi:hypothetical protein
MVGATVTFVLCAALAEPAAKMLTVSVIAIVASAAAVARLPFPIMRFPFASDRIMDSDLIARPNVKAGDNMDDFRASR